VCVCYDAAAVKSPTFDMF